MRFIPCNNANCKNESKIAGNIIENSKCEKLLGIKIDSKLSFKTHMEDLCNRASRKIYALARNMTYIDFPKNVSFLLFFFFFQIPV